MLYLSLHEAQHISILSTVATCKMRASKINKKYYKKRCFVNNSQAIVDRMQLDYASMGIVLAFL